MDTLRCLEILKLECVSSSEELKKAYQDLTQNCQPDRFRGYPRLEKKAAKRLQELKLAYEHLQSYFDPGSGKRLGACDLKPRKISSLPTEKNQPVVQPGKQSTNPDYTAAESSGRESNRFETFQAYPAKRKSPIRRLVAFSFWGLLFGGLGALIYMASNWNVIASKPIGEASGAMEKIVTRLAPDLPDQPENMGAPPNNFSPGEPDMAVVAEHPVSAETMKYFDIYLDGGTVITTSSYWEKDNMVMYKLYGGTMGIEKIRVKKINER